MLTVYVGRAQSGKSQRVLKNIQALGDGGKGQILLVPEHASHAAERDLCRLCGNTASRHAEVLTFKLLASRVLTRTGGLSDYTLDNGGKLLTIQWALQELASQLRVYKRPSTRAAFLGAMMKLFDEFAAYDIAPEELAARVEDMEGLQGDKLRDIVLLYGAYTAKLHTGELDARDRVTKLAEKLEQSGYIDGKDIFIDGFSYFTGQEERVLATMLRRANSVTVTLLGDGNEGGEVFSQALRVRERLLRLAVDCGAESEVVFLPPQADTTALTHVERCFFGGSAVWEGAAPEVTLYRADTVTAEVEWVAAEVLRLVRGGCRFGDITITARSLGAYAASIESIFARCGVPVFQSSRSDILEKPVLALLTGALDAVSGGLEYEDMFRYLKTGLAGIAPEECDVLENYVIRWEIRGSLWLREADWTAHPQGYGMAWDEESEAALAALNALRRRVRAPLLTLHDGLRGDTNAREKTEALYRFLEEIGLPETLSARASELHAAGRTEMADEIAQLWQILCGVMDQFVAILGAMRMDAEEFARLFRLVLTQYSVGTIPVSLDQVNLCELSRNDRHSVKVLFILGATDQALPATDFGGGILSEEDRDALSARQVRLAPHGEAQFTLELQNLYAALAQPTGRLYVSYPASDGAGAAQRPSFVLGRLRTICPGLSDRTENGEGAFRLCAPLPALEAAGESIGGVLWRHFASDEKYRARLCAMERAAQMERGRLSPVAVRTLYGENIHMSASRVDKARQCHFAYFLQYGLRAKKRAAGGFDAPEIGSFIHYILENVTRDAVAAGGFAKLSEVERRALTDRYVEQYTARELGNFRDKTARFRYLFRRLRETVYTIVENLAAELSDSDFVPLAFELKFGGDGALPAIPVSEGETHLQLSGIVDRVDGWVHDGRLYLRVVDYKTGKKSFDLAELRYGLGLQMLLYLFTLEKEGGVLFGREIVPAGVLYMPARDVILPAARNTRPEQVRESVEKLLRRSGMLLGEVPVLQAMEHDALLKPRYLPLRVNKAGEISGSVADAAQLGHLSQYVETLLHKLAREMGEGNIDADPCWHGPDDNACTYCEYADACHFEEGSGRDHIEYIPATPVDEFWRCVEEAVGDKERDDG